jgi:hypothetical protein
MLEIKAGLKRVGHRSMVVESLDAPSAFITDLGLRLDGHVVIEDKLAWPFTRLGHQHAPNVMMVTPLIKS